MILTFNAFGADAEQDSEQLCNWGDARFHGPIHCQECAVACAQAIGETLPVSENPQQLVGKRHRNRAIIVFNLFALEGEFHLYENEQQDSIISSLCTLAKRSCILLHAFKQGTFNNRQIRV